jgi:hypothetical protein
VVFSAGNLRGELLPLVLQFCALAVGIVSEELEAAVGLQHCGVGSSAGNLRGELLPLVLQFCALAVAIASEELEAAVLVQDCGVVISAGNLQLFNFGR